MSRGVLRRTEVNPARLAAVAPAARVIGPDARLFWMAGVLGGYTTFSTFGHETFTLARDGSYAMAALGRATRRKSDRALSPP